MKRRAAFHKNKRSAIDLILQEDVGVTPTGTRLEGSYVANVANKEKKDSDATVGPSFPTVQKVQWCVAMVLIMLDAVEVVDGLLGVFRVQKVRYVSALEMLCTVLLLVAWLFAAVFVS